MRNNHLANSWDVEPICSDPELVQRYAKRVLASDCFARSPQARKFLRFVVEQAAEGKGSELKAYTIGVQALGVQGDRSCPETTARMQATRVRRLLQKYYQTHGRNDRVFVRLPSGSYEPQFIFSTNQEVKGADLPRVHVCDFEALSTSSQDLQFCRGLSDNVVGALVHCPHLKVVRNRVEAGETGGFVLSGSLSRMGSHVRLSAELLCSETGDTLWSERFDEQLGDENFMALLDLLADRIACRVGDPALGTVTKAMRQRDILDEVISATDHFYEALRDPTVERLVRARRVLESTLPQAGGAALVHAAYSCVLSIETILQIAGSKNQILSAEAHARVAVSKDSTCALAHLAKALIHYHHREAACVRRELNRVFELSVANGIIRGIAGLLLCLLGDYEEGLVRLEQARVLVPEVPTYFLIGRFLRDFDGRGDPLAALESAQQVEVEGLPVGELLMTACQSRLGRVIEARRSASRIMTLDGRWAKRFWRNLPDVLFHPETAQCIREALSSAGIGTLGKSRAENAVFRIPPKKRPVPSEIRVGILQSLSGPMALCETHLVSAAMLAIEEINQSGGVLGRPVRALVEDGASDPQLFGAKAERLILRDEVSSLFGCWMSSSRKAVVPVVEQHDNLLWYPLQYEGLESSKNVIYTGSCLNQQIEPAVRWALKQGRSRCYLIGSDYVFPRTANRLIRGLVESSGGEVLGVAYRPLGAARFEQIAAEIAELKPEIVYNTVNGADNVALFEALEKVGVDSKKIPVMSFSLSELELGRCGSSARGHLACWSYFQSMSSEKNRDLVARFRGRYGESEVLSDPGVTAYSQVHLWKDVVERAGSLTAEDVLAHLPGSFLSLGEDRLEVLPNHHVERRAVIGEAQGHQFRVIWSSPRPIEPQPWLGVDTERSVSRDLILSALKALPEMAAQTSFAAAGHR